MSQIIPEWTELGIPEDDSAEPSDAQVEHKHPDEDVKT